MLCSRLMKQPITQPDCKLRAPKCGRVAFHSRSIFSLKTRRASWVSVRGPRTAHPRFGPLWRFHVPRIWNRSINGCKFPVKRKTLNVVARVPPCLFVVVRLQRDTFFAGVFCTRFRRLNVAHLIHDETFPKFCALVLAGVFSHAKLSTDSLSAPRS